MQRRILSAVLLTTLCSASVWAQSSSSSSGATALVTMSGYHPAAGWTSNAGGDASQHSQPSTNGGSSATNASQDEIQLIQQRIASRRAQQAQREARPSPPATPATPPQQR